MSFHTKKQAQERPSKERKPVAVPENKLKTWFPDLSPEVQSKLGIYLEELLKFNKAINLISISSVNKVEAVHFADSILAAQLIRPAIHEGKVVFDFGSGNGFPGLIMSSMFPELEFVLVERDVRKTEFLKHIIARANLKNAKTLVVSVEDLPEGSCHNVVTRGFAALHKCMLLARKPMAKDGKLFHMKGDSFASELAGVPSQLFSHWNASLVGNYTLPETNSVETVVLTEKFTE